MVRQNRVVTVRFGGALITPPLSVVPSRATELLVDSSLLPSSTRGHPQRGLVVLDDGRLAAYELDGVAGRRFCALLKRCQRSLRVVIP